MAGLAAMALGFKPSDLVLGLPDCDRLNSDWFSGYLQVN